MSRFTSVLVGTLWLSALGVGMGHLIRYEKTPSEAIGNQGRWPTGSALAKRSDGPTLLMFAHPRCPCTRASLDELLRVVDEQHALGQVVFYHPRDNAADAWIDSPLVRAVKKSDRLRAVFDPGGVESARFGVITSGECLLYDSLGRLVFSGGVTAGRGHAGPSRSQELLADRLQSDSHKPVDCPAYGCLLRQRDTQ